MLGVGCARGENRLLRVLRLWLGLRECLVVWDRSLLKALNISGAVARAMGCAP